MTNFKERPSKSQEITIQRLREFLKLSKCTRLIPPQGCLQVIQRAPGLQVGFLTHFGVGFQCCTYLSCPFKQSLSHPSVNNSDKLIDSPSWTSVFTFICHLSPLLVSWRLFKPLCHRAWVHAQTGTDRPKVRRNEHSGHWDMHKRLICVMGKHLQGDFQYGYLSLLVENHMPPCWSGSCMLPAVDDKTSNHVWAVWEWDICWGNFRVTIFFYLVWGVLSPWLTRSMSCVWGCLKNSLL